MKLLSRKPKGLNQLSEQPKSGKPLFEFAMTFTLLVGLGIGLIELARINGIRQAADNAAYEAARTAAAPGATAAEAIARAENLLASAGISGASVTVSPSPIAEDSPTVTVEVKAPYRGNSWLPRSITEHRNISRAATLMTERAPVIQAKAIVAAPTS